MKQIIKGLVVAASAALSTSAMAQGILGSPHDLSSGSAELCVYCHTPHAGTTAGGPLWNRNAATGGAYQAYTSTTLNDNTFDPAGVTLACLSCHDGTQARNTVINAPGSGAQGGTITGGETGAITNGIVNALANIGTDLRNDHPVGIAYCGGGLAGTVVTGCADLDFKAPTASTPWTYFEMTSGGITADKNDIRLYAQGGQQQVECASCHDPHNTLNGTFLRVSNARSAICLACHAK